MMSRRHRFLGQTEKRSRPLFTLFVRMLGYLGRFKVIIAIGAVLALVSTIFQAIDPLFLAWGIVDTKASTAPMAIILLKLPKYLSILMKRTNNGRFLFSVSPRNL